MHSGLKKYGGEVLFFALVAIGVSGTLFDVVGLEKSSGKAQATLLSPHPEPFSDRYGVYASTQKSTVTAHFSEGDPVRLFGRELKGERLPTQAWFAYFYPIMFANRFTDERVRNALTLVFCEGVEQYDAFHSRKPSRVNLLWSAQALSGENISKEYTIQCEQ